MLFLIFPRTGDLKSVPVRSLDSDVEVLIIRGPRNNIIIGPIFAPFLQLKVLRITDSNVPAIGKNSFWGCQNLRILGKLLQYDKLTVYF